MQIYLLKADQVSGPYTLQEAKSRVARGEFGTGDQAWTEGEDQWLPLEAHPLLKGYCGLAKFRAPDSRAILNEKSWQVIAWVGGATFCGSLVLLTFLFLLLPGKEKSENTTEDFEAWAPSSAPLVQDREQPRQPCLACQGSGKSRGRGICVGCGGRGVRTTPSGHTLACNRCEGTGSPPSNCVYCAGTGFSNRRGITPYGW